MLWVRMPFSFLVLQAIQCYSVYRSHRCKQRRGSICYVLSPKLHQVQGEAGGNPYDWYALIYALTFFKGKPFKLSYGEKERNAQFPWSILYLGMEAVSLVWKFKISYSSRTKKSTLCVLNGHHL